MPSRAFQAEVYVNVRRGELSSNAMSAVWPSFPGVQGRDHVVHQRPILQNDRVQVAPERRLDRGNEFFLDFDERGERTFQSGQNLLRLVESTQNGLRTLGKAFAFRVELSQDFEPRLTFGDRAIAAQESSLGLAKFLLLRGHFFFRGVNLGDEILQGFLLAFAGRPHIGQIFRHSIARESSFA